MPAVSLSVLNALSAAAPSASAQPSHDGEGFQSLLDINSPVAQDAGDRKREHRREALAAPLDADAHRITAESGRRAPEAAFSDHAAKVDRPVIPRHEAGEVPVRPRPEESSRRVRRDAPDEASAEGVPVDNPILPPQEGGASDSDTLQVAPAALLPGMTEVFAALEDSLAVLPGITPLVARSKEGSPALAFALPMLDIEAAQHPALAASADVRPDPLKPFLSSLESLIERLDKFLLSGAHVLAADRESSSFVNRLRDFLNVLQTMYKEVASGSVSVADAQKKLRPVLADLQQILSKLDPAGKLPWFYSSPADTLAEPLPAFPARRLLAERADAAPNMPQTNMAANANQAAAAAVAGSTSGNGGAHSGAHSDTGSPMPQPMAAVRAAGAPSEAPETGAANFARALSHASRPQPVAEQVVFHIKTALADGSSRIRIQLEPAELGKLDIKMHVDAAGKTGVTITADNRNTLDLLQRDARGLERALADAGLTADSGNLSFNLKGGERQAQDSAQASGLYQKTMPESEAPADNVLTRSYVVNLAEGLDIRI